MKKSRVKVEKKRGKVRDWNIRRKPTGGFHSKAGVQLSTFIRDHLIGTGGDHIQATHKAYKRVVKQKAKGKKYHIGSYMNTKYYFYMLKTLGLIKPMVVKRKPRLRMGQKVVASPIVYRVVNSGSDAWEHPRKNYAQFRGLMK